MQLPPRHPQLFLQTGGAATGGAAAGGVPAAVVLQQPRGAGLPAALAVGGGAVHQVSVLLLLHRCARCPFWRALHEPEGSVKGKLQNNRRPVIDIGAVIPLSSSLFGSGAPIFLLDTHTEVLVYYAPGSEGQPFPPPQGSLLRNAINAARAGRRMTPRLRLLRSGASPDDDRCCTIKLMLYRCSYSILVPVRVLLYDLLDQICCLRSNLCFAVDAGRSMPA